MKSREEFADRNGEQWMHKSQTKEQNDVRDENGIDDEYKNTEKFVGEEWKTKKL